MDTGSLASAVDNLTASNQLLTWSATPLGCGFGGAQVDVSYSVDGGLGRDDVTLAYNPGFYSYAGCRCSSGYDNIYTFDQAGSLECMRFMRACGPHNTLPPTYGM